MSFVKLRVHDVWSAAAFFGVLSLGFAQSAMANTLCVNPGGTSGCYTTIGAAMTAAAAGDTINVGPGQYTEDVVVSKPLTLAGSGTNATIINAKGLANGIYVNGLDNGGLSGVTVAGFTVMNANFEGILLTDTSYSLIANNRVVNNNQSLNFAAASCPGLPIFETSEGMDCGEGIHLVGVHHTTVANNVSELNSGGMLISDETGMTYANNITGNSIQDNA
ncbi:MAG: right-handed parallel beta-helix repeat-containing protein, partial [Bryobacteraceae bacterium]